MLLIFLQNEQIFHCNSIKESFGSASYKVCLGERSSTDPYFDVTPVSVPSSPRSFTTPSHPFTTSKWSRTSHNFQGWSQHSQKQCRFRETRYDSIVFSLLCVSVEHPQALPCPLGLSTMSGHRSLHRLPPHPPSQKPAPLAVPAASSHLDQSQRPNRLRSMARLPQCPSSRRPRHLRHPRPPHHPHQRRLPPQS